jgi:hypothetical protein
MQPTTSTFSTRPQATPTWGSPQEDRGSADTGQQTSPEHPPPHTTGVRVQIPHLWGGRVHQPVQQRRGVSSLWVAKSVGRPPRLERPHQLRGMTRVTGGRNLKGNQKTTKSRPSTTRHTNSTRSTTRAFRGRNRRSQGTFWMASGEQLQQKVNGSQDSLLASDRSLKNTTSRPSTTWRGTNAARSQGPTKRNPTPPRPTESKLTPPRPSTGALTSIGESKTTFAMFPNQGIRVRVRDEGGLNTG